MNDSAPANLEAAALHASQAPDSFLAKTQRLAQQLASYELSDIMTMMVAASFYNMDEEQFAQVLPYGQRFRATPMTSIPPRFSVMQACFQNCTYFTKHGTDSQLLYCEGWASGAMLPVLHAWVSPKPNVAWDPTWQANMRLSVEEVEYWGFAFKPGRLPELLDNTGCYGIFDSPAASNIVMANPQDWLMHPEDDTRPVGTE